MFVNVDMCEIGLIRSESTDYEFSTAIFIELLKFWSEVLTIVLGCIRMSGDVSLSCPFLKIEKIALIMGKNALIVLIRGLNVHLCSNLKCWFKST